MQYPNNLKHLRLKHHFTQQHVARLLNHKSVSRLSPWEQGSAFPSIPNLLKLSAIYNVPAERMYPKHTRSIRNKIKYVMLQINTKKPSYIDDKSKEELLKEFSSIIADIYLSIDTNEKLANFLHVRSQKSENKAGKLRIKRV